MPRVPAAYRAATCLTISDGIRRFNMHGALRRRRGTEHHDHAHGDPDDRRDGAVPPPADIHDLILLQYVVISKILGVGRNSRALRIRQHESKRDLAP